MYWLNSADQKASNLTTVVHFNAGAKESLGLT